MAKILNVDGLAQEKKEIVLKGITHVIKEMSVEDFLVTMEAADKLEVDSSPKAQIDAIVAMVARAIPSLTDVEARALPFDQLNAIASFIRGEISDSIKHAITEEKDKAGN
jgi:hypothetical protein